MKELEQIYFKDRKSFRGWLEENHLRSQGIWMIFYKKHADRESVNYIEALEEALCFGWIDSLVKKVDDERYVRKFTPRTNKTKWSELNKKIVLSLIEKGKMTEYGLKKIDIYLKTGKVDWSPEEKGEKKIPVELSIPDFILNEFAKDEPALENFNKLTQTYKRHYIMWITSSKKEETMQSRLRESIKLLKGNKKLGLK